MTSGQNRTLAHRSTAQYPRPLSHSATAKFWFYFNSTPQTTNRPMWVSSKGQSRPALCSLPSSAWSLSRPRSVGPTTSPMASSLWMSGKSVPHYHIIQSHLHCLLTVLCSAYQLFRNEDDIKSVALHCTLEGMPSHCIW